METGGKGDQGKKDTKKTVHLVLPGSFVLDSRPKHLCACVK